MANTPQYGITPPISISNPTDNESEKTNELIETLKEFNVFESDEESRKRREVVLAKLSVIVKQFVRKISLERNLPEAIADEAGGKIFTFGSYRLGCNLTGADIDTLCVVPKYVNRNDFFTVLHQMILNTPGITEVTAVPDSYVPIIKLVFDGIHIDFVFARLNLSRVGDSLDLRDDLLLKGLDERCVRSLNGSRVTDEILRLVPNILTFRTANRCIKIWAKNRAIYSNVMGFPGGVAWAMMVARVCQLYPNATASLIVQKFFYIMGSWTWPTPILLKPLDEGNLNLGMRVWNPKVNPADRAHRMPVITPAYPSMCATHNVTTSTLAVIKQELHRAIEITDKIMNLNESWSLLFTMHDFFHRYKYYLQVIASSDSMDHQRVWSSLVESRLRHLVIKLEYVENLVLAHPFIKGFDNSFVCTSEESQINAGRGLPIPETSEDTSNKSTDEPKKTPLMIYTTTFYIGLEIEPRQKSVGTEPRKLDISWPTSEFTKMCRSWELYNDSSMGLCVKYIKNKSLPLEVFEEGEKRPRRTKTKANASSQPFKKHKSLDVEATDLKEGLKLKDQIGNDKTAESK